MIGLPLPLRVVRLFRVSASLYVVQSIVEVLGIWSLEKAASYYHWIVTSGPPKERNQIWSDRALPWIAVAFKSGKGYGPK